MASTPIVSVSGVRGIVGDSLDASVLTRFATAFGTFIASNSLSVGSEKTVVIGRDSRTSGEMVRHAVLAGLIATGCQVIDVGLCPTPTVLLMSKALNAQGSIVITASHNPVDWNGIEFARESGRLLSQADRERLMRIYESGEFLLTGWNQQGSVETVDGAIDRHIASILNCDWVNLDLTRAKALKVVIDCGNGAGSVISPRLLRMLGCQVIELNCVPDGNFPRAAEPNPEALDGLRETVLSTDADVGFAHDGDADRLVLVSDKGTPLSGEYTFAFTAEFLLNKRKSDLVATVSTSRMLDDIADKHSVTLHRTPVGVGFVVDKMRESGTLIGGEGTGGVIYPEIQYTSDGIASIAAIVQLLAESGRTISELVDAMPNYAMCKKKLEIPSQEHAEIVVQHALMAYTDESKKRAKDAAVLDVTDGVKRVWNDRWVNIRKSGTEPVIRVFSEARTAEQAEALCDETLETLRMLMKQALH